MKIGERVMWLMTAGGKPCTPRPALVTDTKHAEYGVRIKGAGFDCWVRPAELAYVKRGQTP